MKKAIVAESVPVPPNKFTKNWLCDPFFEFTRENSTNPQNPHATRHTASTRRKGERFSWASFSRVNLTFWLYTDGRDDTTNEIIHRMMMLTLINADAAVDELMHCWAPFSMIQLMALKLTKRMAPRAAMRESSVSYGTETSSAQSSFTPPLTFEAASVKALG